MNRFLRYEPGKKTPDISTIFDFSSTDGIVRAAEKCNGSAIAVKPKLSEEQCARHLWLPVKKRLYQGKSKYFTRISQR